MTDAGKYNKRIKYPTVSTVVSDGYGGQTITAGTPVETWCSANQLGMDVALRYGMDAGQSNYQFALRYEQGKNIKQGDILIYDSRNFKVKQIIDIDEDSNEVKILAYEHID